jgi:hypothetical protein
MAGRGAALPRSPHVPQWLEDLRRPVHFAPGCYWNDPPRQSFLWVRQ